jgi:hypothetical protein
MDGTTQTEARVTCEYCSETISAQDQNCTSCGYPIKGNKEERRQFISLKGRMKHELKELKTKVENAQITFYVLSVLFFLVGVISYFTVKDKGLSLNLLIENLILCTIFLALGGWSKTKPVTCILLGLIFYILSQIMGLIAGYTGPFKGIIIKIFIIIIMIKGLVSALDAERIKKEHRIS